MGTVETGTLSQLLLWSAKWLGDPSKGNTSQGTDGATLGLLSRLSGVPGQVAVVPLQPPITPMTPTTPTTLTTPTTPTSREGTSSHTFDQTPMILTSREETSNPTFGQVTACQVLLAALPSKISDWTTRALCLTWRPVGGTWENHKWQAMSMSIKDGTPFQQGPLLTQSLHSREDSHSHHPLAVEEPVHHHVARVAAQALGEEPAPQPAQVLAHSHSPDLAQCLSPCHSLCQHPCHSPCLCHSLLLCPSLCNLGTAALGVVAKFHSQADVNWVLDLRWVLFLAQLRLQDVVPQTEICPLMGLRQMDGCPGTAG